MTSLWDTRDLPKTRWWKSGWALFEPNVYSDCRLCNLSVPPYNYRQRLIRDNSWKAIWANKDALARASGIYFHTAFWGELSVNSDSQGFHYIPGNIVKLDEFVSVPLNYPSSTCLYLSSSRIIVLMLLIFIHSKNNLCDKKWKHWALRTYFLCSCCCGSCFLK